MITNSWLRTTLGAQWLRLCSSNAGDTGSTLSQGTKIPHAMQHSRIKHNHQSWCLLDACCVPGTV